jgi:hypothetical protein
MADARSLTELPDAALESALRDLGSAIAVPAPGPDLASRVRGRLEASATLEHVRPRPRPWWRIGRAGALAVAALLVLAALAAAAILGAPGIRIVFVPGAAPTPTLAPTGAPSSSPSGGTVPSASVDPGTALGLGVVLPLDQAASQAGLAPLLPSDVRLQAPDATYLTARRLTFAWLATSTIPELTGARGFGLLLTEFRGRVDPGYFEKQVGTGTGARRVRIRGADGWWLTGNPHFFFYVDDRGVVVDETRRLAGNVLVWEEDGITYRLESPFGKAETIAIAEGLGRPG